MLYRSNHTFLDLETSKNRWTGTTLLDLTWYILICSLFVINYVPGGNIIVNGLILLFIFLVSIKIFINGSIKWVRPITILFIFSGFMILTYFYSYSPDLVLVRSITMMQLAVFSIFAYNYLDCHLKIERTLNALEFAGLLLFFTLFLNGELFGGGRAGSTIGDVNTLGIYVSLIASISLWRYLYRRRKLSGFIFILLSTLTLLTGSRSALVVLFIVVTIFLFLWLRGPIVRRLFYIFLISILILPILNYLIFEVPLLYNTIGIRIESMIDIISGRNSSIQEQSTQTRTFFILYGTEMFIQRPFFGWGIESFRQKIGDMTGFYTYSHNNYIELLFSLGIVGFSLYYSIYIYIIKRIIILLKGVSLKNKKYFDKDFYVLAIGLVIGLLVKDLFLVLYYQKAEILFLIIIIAIINLKKKSRPLKKESAKYEN